ncbi:hypothetical protein [Desulfospira joergensenii]|uniref:DUF6812 domain-containing protein n=1 Tax=Desulfospira joergensenii TaxID=53329 RepID=UPI0012946916|nr:hypothetical protein [Desulfospira joergensenii]
MEPGQYPFPEPNGSRPIKSRIVRLKLIDGTLVSGQVNINQEYGYDRLSDLLSSRKESFLVLFKVAVYDEKSGSPVKHETLFINKRQIIWAEPDDQK